MSNNISERTDIQYICALCKTSMSYEAASRSADVLGKMSVNEYRDIVRGIDESTCGEQSFVVSGEDRMVTVCKRCLMGRSSSYRQSSNRTTAEEIRRTDMQWLNDYMYARNIDSFLFDVLEMRPELLEVFGPVMRTVIESLNDIDHDNILSVRPYVGNDEETYKIVFVISGIDNDETLCERLHDVVSHKTSLREYGRDICFKQDDLLPVHVLFKTIEAVLSGNSISPDTETYDSVQNFRYAMDDDTKAKFYASALVSLTSPRNARGGTYDLTFFDPTNILYSRERRDEMKIEYFVDFDMEHIKTWLEDMETDGSRFADVDAVIRTIDEFIDDGYR